MYLLRVVSAVYASRFRAFSYYVAAATHSLLRMTVLPNWIRHTGTHSTRVSPNSNPLPLPESEHIHVHAYTIFHIFWNIVYSTASCLSVSTSLASLHLVSPRTHKMYNDGLVWVKRSLAASRWQPSICKNIRPEYIVCESCFTLHSLAAPCE